MATKTPARKLMKSIARLGLGLALALLAPACGGSGGGSCVNHDTSYPASYKSCCDESQSDCTTKQQNFGGGTNNYTYSPSSCASQGYTLQCAGEGPNCYRLPAFAPCP